MRRLLFSTKALWHQWRALKMARHARGLLEAAEAHEAEAAINLMASRALARGPMPAPKEDDPRAGCSFAGQMLLASLVGMFIAGLWIWISARAGR
ncbi:MAG: hypothetical protein WBA42_01575 [Mesorhizobium sp.]